MTFYKATIGPITKLCAGWREGKMEDMCYEIRRATACVDESDHALVHAGKGKVNLMLKLPECHSS